MKTKFFFSFFLFCIIAITSHAQIFRPDSNYWGGSAPPLRVNGWIKGNPVKKFEAGKIYVLDFWATWCAPCMASMPRLSILARKYRNTVTVIAIDVFEQKTTAINKIKAQVDSLGSQMNFSVAMEDTNFTVHDWFGKDLESIPKDVVINSQGKVAWIGHPKDLPDVLSKILKGTWNIQDANQTAINQEKLSNYLDSLERAAGSELTKYEGDFYTKDDLGNPDSALLLINKLVVKEPKLKFAPLVSAFTFTALLKINPDKAYQYGQELLMTPSYEGLPAYNAIIGGIKDYMYKLDIPAEIYKLGADAYCDRIGQCPYPELFDDPEVYTTIANWYWLAGDKRKAMKAKRKVKRLLNKKT